MDGKRETQDEESSMVELELAMLDKDVSFTFFDLSINNLANKL